MNQPDNEGLPSQTLGEGSFPDEAIPSHRSRSSNRNNTRRTWALLVLITYLFGLGNGYLLWGRESKDSGPQTAEAESRAHIDVDALLEQINPPEGYQLPIRYGDFAPKLIAAGVIDYTGFVKLYEEIGSPLSNAQKDILVKGSDAPIVINKENQHFLLNLFWALGLANQNRILIEGPMMRNGKEKVVNFASTGGWTLASKPVGELYASQSIISLSEEQQKRLEEVAAGVYRPCCDNPTHFPDCNHGMAMLGLLELMTMQDASVDEMFEAAKYVNAFWFPQQTLEVAVLFKSINNADFASLDARQAVGPQLSSGSGFQAVHQKLIQSGVLDQAPNGGGSCGVK